MNAEWSRRAGIVLDSPYWHINVETDEDLERFTRMREDELYPLKDAVQAADSYDDLTPDMRVIFDRAEEAARQAQTKWEEFARNDTDGYGRFHETIEAAPTASAEPPPPGP